MYEQKYPICAVFFAINCFVGVITCYKIVSTSDVYSKDNINFYEYNSDNQRNYNFSFQSPEIDREESGQVINVGQPDQYIRVTGKYSYVEEGLTRLQTVYYIADKDGYRIDENRTKTANDLPPLGFKDFNNLDLVKTLIGG